MDRRKFLALFGMGACGGVAGASLARSNASPETSSPTDAVVSNEQEDENPTSSGMQRIIWSVDTEQPIAALTFDDGPDPEFTPHILDILDRHEAKATFMVMGYNAVRHSNLLRDIVAAGHEVGGHGWSHRNLSEATPEQASREIEYGNRMIEERAGVPLRVFRPPYGRFSQAAVRLLASSPLDLVVWSVTRGDLSWKEPRSVASHVVRSLSPGDIIDLHDGIGRGTFNRGKPFGERLRRRRETEIQALPGIIEGARAKGLRLDTVSDLIAAWKPSDVG